MKKKWLMLLAVSGFIGLSLQSVYAACSPTGIITGANGSITLASGNCADASGNTSANIISGASITNAGGSGLIAPIAAGHNPWNITNDGTINVGGTGIALQDGGDTVTNNGTITSTGGNGINSVGGAGVSPVIINNSGNIDATTGLSGMLLDGGANVTNSGTIAGAFTGISISANGASSTGGPSSVTNSGTIESTGNFNTAIVLGLGGTVTNQTGGLIVGEGAGVTTAVNAGTVNNAGTIGDINNTSTSVGLGAGGTVNNFSGGQLVAQSRGVSIDGGSGIVNNAGTISAANGRAIDFGVTSSGGTVNNTATGIISSSGLGTRAIIFEGGSGTVNNAGTISGGLIAAIQMLIGSSAVNNSGTITGNVIFTQGSDTFLMTTGQMTGELIMGTGGNEQATFQNVTDTNIGTISLFNGGGGGGDQLIFNASRHTGGSDMINWETISLTNGAALTLSSNLTLGNNGASGVPTARLNITNATLNANNAFNTIIQAQQVTNPVLVNNGGTINIASTLANNSLIIRGNYVGNSGTIKLNAALSDDSSPADKLVIDGQNGSGSASGNSFINVHNTTGTGAKTTGNGVLVVEAINNATTTTNAFALSSPLRVGAYDYRLFRSGLDPSAPAFAEDWFLRSTFAPNPNNPSSNGPQVIVGPELSVYGSALPTAMAMSHEIVATLHERVGDEANLLTTSLSDQRFANGGWVRAFTQPYHAQYSSIVDPSAAGTITGMQTGLDLFRAKTAGGALNFIGLYFAYANANPDIDGTVTNPMATADIRQHTGSIELNGTTGGAYWTHFWQNESYLDLVAQSTAFHGDANSSRTSLPLRGTGATASAELGYPLNATGLWTVEPETQFIYEYAKFNAANDSFSSVDLGSTNATIGRVGARLKYTTPLNYGILQAYLRANVWSVLSDGHANAVYAGTDSIVTTAKSSWTQLGAGVTVTMSHRTSLYGYVDDLVNMSHGHHVMHGMDGGAGIRVNC